MLIKRADKDPKLFRTLVQDFYKFEEEIDQHLQN